MVVEDNCIKQLKMKAKVYRTKPGCVDHSDLTVIYNTEEACENLLTNPYLNQRLRIICHLILLDFE